MVRTGVPMCLRVVEVNSVFGSPIDIPMNSPLKTTIKSHHMALVCLHFNRAYWILYCGLALVLRASIGEQHMESTF